MAKIGRPGLSREKRAELWERWKSGQCASDIARALERTKGAIHHVLAFNGGIAPVARRRCPVALVLDEREEISRGIAAGRSIRGIAAGLGRSPSTVSREVARHGGRSAYRATEADARAWERALRPKPCRLAQPSRATMARCREAGARLVARADLGVAQARIPCRRRLAGVPRNHLSQFVCSGPRGAQEGVDGASSGRAAHAPSERRHHTKSAAGPDRRCDFDPGTSRRSRGPCRSRPLGRRPALGGQQLAHGDAGRAPFPLRDADQGAGKGHAPVWCPH